MKLKKLFVLSVIALSLVRPSLEIQAADVKKITKRAEEGDVVAQYKLYRLYHFGVNIKKDEKKAIAWLEKAAEQGCMEAQIEFGKYCSNANEKVMWYKKAAEQGSKNAQYYLGECYEKGVGVEQSNEEAYKWYKKAAEQDSKDAQYALGKFYEEGIGVEQSYEEAYKWYKLAQTLRSNDEASRAAKRIKNILEKNLMDETQIYRTGITYSHIIRTPNDYVTQKVMFTGKVIQIFEDNTELNQMYLDVGDRNNSHIIYCEYNPSIISYRLLENDKITIYGSSVGLINLMGDKLPSIVIERIEMGEHK